MKKYTVAELAELFNLTERRIYQLTEEKIIPKASRNKYELKQALQAYVKYLQDLASSRNSTSEQKALKTRLLAAQTEKAELELEVLKGKYMEVSEVEFEWGNLVLAFRSKMLVLPTKLVRSLAEAGGNFAEIERILETEIHDALLELSKYEPEEESDNGNNQQQVSTAAETDSISMG
ncbi:hypothetical protein [Rickettsia endosymbiont of Orchestes rusci]|uniref:hypothetical protein n=1 Tax=Rickettsia endosymbiont of Orchestes rusci TaxID=3066250 RepID=UPI00313B27EC